MAVPSYPTSLIPRPFASGGDANTIPDSTEASGQASWTKGFPFETQQPINEGGMAPTRVDFNGIFQAITQVICWTQAGGMTIYSLQNDYNTPSIVFYGGGAWFCVAPNGPGTTVGAIPPGSNESYWITLAAFIAGSGGGSSYGVPVGTVISYYGTTAPDGYFICDGSPFSQTDYPQLAALLGSTLVPDLRGEFIRGLSAGREGVDPNRELGSTQGDTIRNIVGSFSLGGLSDGSAAASSGAFGLQGLSKAASGRGAFAYGTVTFDASRTGIPVAEENRPRNVALLLCIKHD